MEKIASLSTLHEKLNEHTVALLYISRPNCSVCHAVLPQVEELLTNYPQVKMLHVNADDVPEIAGEYAIFTIPVIIFFVEGKEMFRKARFIPMGELEHSIKKIVELM
ncbi:thioredoxin family protein [Bacillus sp. FJAT-52991]|uniref:Thioredoxin family protein n=1 Tax=Bacillus kandeliae TaxID=3129297 RepID=A0ABZ2N956_9BACI